MEIAGAGRRDIAETELAKSAVRRALEAADVLRPRSGDVVSPTVALAGSDAIRTEKGGVLLSLVEVGQDVLVDQELCTITDFDGEPLESIRAPRSGRLLLRSVARVVSPGALVAKVGWIPE
jgi:predicted deacylase